jgi:hypothetical protein
MRIALALTVFASTAAASPRQVCTTGPNRCLSQIVTAAEGIRPFGAQMGWGPTDLQSAYQIDPNITTTPTVAIVDAYGYTNLEADLATYRSTYGLPPCTRTSGCLTILNEHGATSPLPPNAPASDDWTVETALDVDMASAACPRCKIIVVQADSTSGTDLYTAQNAAAGAHPTVISDSYGGPESGDMTAAETYFDHPGIAQFVSSGDSGWDDGGNGPLYPSTSAHVIAVGGTSLVPAGNARGWSESAWTMGGSSCSGSIAKPAYQTQTACAKRAASDISAVGDPATGVSVYNSANGGWLVVGGTSAAAPIVAATFASIGKGNVTAADIAHASAALFDVTSGSNGACGNILCNAGAGWDGPTGYGTPSAAALSGTSPPSGGVSVAITAPGDRATVQEGFVITATATNAVVVGAFVDGVLIGKSTAAPYKFTTPHMPAGPHTVQVAALDANNDEADASEKVTVTEPPVMDDGGDMSSGGGCNAGGHSPGMLVLLALLLRKRRV